VVLTSVRLRTIFHGMEGVFCGLTARNKPSDSTYQEL